MYSFAAQSSGYVHTQPCLAFDMGVEDSDLGPHVLVLVEEILLPSEPSSQPKAGQLVIVHNERGLFHLYGSLWSGLEFLIHITKIWGWGGSSVIEHLLSMHETQGSPLRQRFEEAKLVKFAACIKKK